MTKTFDHLIILGRPASGKSEFIDFLKSVPDGRRTEGYHIGKFDVIDDFPILWEKFIEDDLWEKIGEKRRYSDVAEHAYNTRGESRIADFMIAKLDHEITNKYLKRPEFYEDATLIIEFARGKPDGGYKSALNILSDDVLQKAGILYIDVSFEESRRRNEARYQEKLKHSILAHKVPESDMERYAKYTDWRELTLEKEFGHVSVRGLKIPFVTMNNEPESEDPVVLDERYGSALDRLGMLAGLKTPAAGTAGRAGT